MFFSLTKVIIDSLNEREIIKWIKSHKNYQKGIDKLETFFDENNIPGFEKHIQFLRNLQELRSKSVAHRKSTNYEKEIRKLNFLDFENKGYIDNFSEILVQVIDLLEFLKSRFQNATL